MSSENKEQSVTEQFVEGLDLIMKIPFGGTACG